MLRTLAIAASLSLAAPAIAQDAAPPAEPSPNEIVNAAPAEDWVAIPAEDLLVMTLAPPAHGPGQADRDGNEREVVIQMIPEPFSQGWVENIRTLARARWYDGISVNRVQDNYVVQWGDPGYDNPESSEVKTKPVPEGLNVMGEDEYTVESSSIFEALVGINSEAASKSVVEEIYEVGGSAASNRELVYSLMKDAYAHRSSFLLGFPFGFEGESYDSLVWPVHCYGMVGVGRGYSPDTGTGAELYTVIGHAPRHLDRNIALVGRIIDGMEHLSSLPRGSGALGFYTEEEADKRTPIRSIRVAADLPEDQQPTFEYLSTETETFARYAKARANRRDPFFIVPAGGADICNIPVPVRAFAYTEK